MKVYLMHLNRDFDTREPLPLNARDLLDDLELQSVLDVMAAGDEFVLDVSRNALLGAVHSDIETISYRQDILDDALRHPRFIRDLYALATSSQEIRKKGYWGLSLHRASGVLHSAAEFIANIIPLLREVRMLASEAGINFQSTGLQRLFSMLEEELSDDYIAVVQQHLKTLKFPHGFVMSAQLGKGNKGRDYVIRTPNPDKRSWILRLLDRRPPAQHYTLSPRDEAGAQALSNLGDRGINPVANALGQSAEHIMSFFMTLRTELAFYVGCINLRDRLMADGQSVCMPQARAEHERCLDFTALSDLALFLKLGKKVVPNDLAAGNRDLIIITGANQGGKSSFLRSIGMAQLMMQAGMFVTATSFSANLCNGLYTHYKREEDAGMESGKFDEELKRMSAIVDAIKSDALILFNESFAATNEREGSEIARQIVDALLSRRIKVLFVSHQFEFSYGFFRRDLPNALFLRAERQVDGSRTFRISEGEPLQTSYGLDLYRDIFGKDGISPDGKTAEKSHQTYCGDSLRHHAEERGG